MGDVNFTTGTQVTELIGTNLVKAQNTINFATNNATSSGGVCEILSIPAGALVFRVFIIMTTVEGSAFTFNIGDGDDENGYDDAVNGNSLTAGIESGPMTAPTAGTDNYAEGKYYASADTIDIALDNDADAAILKVVAIYCMVE